MTSSSLHSKKAALHGTSPLIRRLLAVHIQSVDLLAPLWKHIECSSVDIHCDQGTVGKGRTSIVGCSSWLAALWRHLRTWCEVQLEDSVVLQLSLLFSIRLIKGTNGAFTPGGTSTGCHLAGLPILPAKEGSRLLRFDYPLMAEPQT